MKIHRILFVCLAIMIPQLVNAKLPFTNDVFGRLEGTFDFCAKADAGPAPKYREFAKLLVKDVPDKELTEARMTAEYKDSYEGMQGFSGNEEVTPTRCNLFLRQYHTTCCWRLVTSWLIVPWRCLKDVNRTDKI